MVALLLVLAVAGSAPASSPASGLVGQWESAVDDALYSVGAGAELHTDVTTLGDTALRFDWAHPVGHYNDPNVSSDTFFVQLLQDF